MRGFKVVLPDGAAEIVAHATHYVVGDDGGLAILAGDAEVQAYAPGAWIEIRELGVRLLPTWPALDLDELLDHLHYDLCVGWGSCEPLGPASEYESPLLNDLDSFVAAVLGTVGVETPSSSNRELIERVRGRTAKWFGLPP